MDQFTGSGQAIAELEAKGLHVIVNRIGSAPLDEATVVAIREGQTYSRTDRSGPGDDLTTRVINKTVFGSGDTYDYTCFTVLARLGRIFATHAIFLSQLLQKGVITPTDTERIVIRVAWRMGCQYEYAHHTRMALALGVARTEIETLTNANDDQWSERTRTLLTAADELLATKNLSQQTFQRLRQELNPDQILEFTMLVGHYVMAGMILSVAGVEIEPAFALTTL